MVRDFAMHEYRLLQRLANAGWRPGCIYDIGASNTCWSSMMRRHLPDAEFHLFEPLADEYGRAFPSFERAVETAIDPDIAHDLKPIEDFTMHRVALGETTGECSMLTDAQGYSSTTLPEAPGKPHWWTRRGSIPQYRLDDLVAEKGIAAPSLIKIDTQGSELRILKGAATALASCDVLLLETWLTREYGPETPLLGELIEWLVPRGFAVFDFGHKFWDDKSHRLYAIDAYFARPEFLTRYGHAARGVAAPSLLATG